MVAGVARLTLDTGHLMQRFHAGAVKGGRQGAEGALRRIKARAPVRKLFRGTTYHNVNIGGEMFRQPIKRMVRTRTAGGTKTGRMQLDEDRDVGSAAVGHANSLEPLFRFKAGKTTYYATGDFRRVDTAGRRRRHPEDQVPSTIGRLGMVDPKEIDLYTKKGGKIRHEHPTAAISGEKLNIGGGRLITNRGKWEVRSGRADFRDPSTGVVRVGGRLRGEIHIEGPVDEGGVLTFYIVSATKDPATGRLYPRDQEFGTRHHPPHPFLRPGLRESRNQFAKAVDRGMAEELRKQR